MANRRNNPLAGAWDFDEVYSRSGRNRYGSTPDVRPPYLASYGLHDYDPDANWAAARRSSWGVGATRGLDGYGIEGRPGLNVELTGTVSDRWAKRRAYDDVEGCPGVREVNSRLKVSRAGGRALSARLACVVSASHVTGMVNGERASILADRLAGYRARSHDELTGLLLAPVADEVTGPSGKRYQMIVQASWTGSPGGDLRVVGGVDDRGWQLFNPLTDSFVSRPAARTGG